MSDPYTSDAGHEGPAESGRPPQTTGSEQSFPGQEQSFPGTEQSFSGTEQSFPGREQSFPGAADDGDARPAAPAEGFGQTGRQNASGDASFGQPSAPSSDPYGAPNGSGYGQAGQPGAPGYDRNGQPGAPGFGQDNQPGGYGQTGPQGGPGAGYGPTGGPGVGADPTGMQVPGSWSDVPPPGIKGVSTAPMNGEPISDSDAKLWAMLAQLSVILGYFFAVLAWVGPLVVYLMYKDRNRFVRFHAAEALNSSIAVLIVSFVLAILTGIFTVITFGLGSPTLALIGVPAIVQIIFAIIAAVKANARTWWHYPVNIRLFS